MQTLNSSQVRDAAYKAVAEAHSAVNSIRHDAFFIHVLPGLEADLASAIQYKDSLPGQSRVDANRVIERIIRLKRSGAYRSYQRNCWDLRREQAKAQKRNKRRL